MNTKQFTVVLYVVTALCFFGAFNSKYPIHIQDEFTTN